MLSNATSTLRHHHLNRRGFLKITGIATAATVLGAAPAGHLAYAAALTKAQREKLTPDDYHRTDEERATSASALDRSPRTITSPSRRQPPRGSIPQR